MIEITHCDFKIRIHRKIWRSYVMILVFASVLIIFVIAKALYSNLSEK